MQENVSECTTCGTMKLQAWAATAEDHTSVNNEQVTEATVYTGSSKLEERRLEKHLIVIMHDDIMQQTNLQQLHNVTSVWTKISGKCFQNLV